MSDLGDALATMLGGNYLDYFSLDGRSYKVIPQAKQNDRLTADQLLARLIRKSAPEG
ncbi:multidrug efflux pump subunit AcrB [Bradyrhizobium liaoningense]